MIIKFNDIQYSLKNFINLNTVTYDTKVRIITKLFTKEQNIKWSILCSESVLHIFEDKYPNDNRPRNAIKAAQTYLDNPTEENRNAAYAAANAAAANAAAYAAAAAAYAAANAAYAAYAANAAAYAANTAAYAAANAAYAANEKNQEKYNLECMLKVVYGKHTKKYINLPGDYI